MCYNCGCRKAGTVTWGIAKNITNKPLMEAAKAAKTDLEEAKRKAYETLKRGIRKKK